MDTESIKVWLQAINMLGTFALGVWLYLEKRSDKTNDRIGDVEEDVDKIKQDVAAAKAICEGCQVGGLVGEIKKIDRDVSALKAASEQAPSHDNLSEMYKSINDLAEKVNTLVGESEEQGKTLRQILNRIIERGMQ